MTIKTTFKNVKILDDEDSVPGYHFEYHGFISSDAAHDYMDAADASAYDALRMTGGDGNDTVLGNYSLEMTLDGGNGNDLLFSRRLSSWIQFNGGNGIDTLDLGSTPAQYDDDTGVVADLTAGTVALIKPWISTYHIARVFNVEHLIGTIHADQLTGNKAANRLLGGLGADTLSGAAGNDLLDGDDGDDVLGGGAGDDTVSGGAGNDRLVQDALAGKDWLNGGDGIDTVDYTRSTLIATDSVAIILQNQGLQNGVAVKFRNGKVVDQDTLSSIENATGSIGNDTLIGSVANNELNGGAGSDSIAGGGGDDRIIVDNGMPDTIDGGDGTDTADYSAMAGHRGIHAILEQGIIRKYLTIPNFSGTARDIVRGIEVIVGTMQADVLIGDDLNNKLVGGEGNDFIIGNAGDDSLDGGSANDMLMGGAGDDVVSGGPGNDLLRIDGRGVDRYLFDDGFGQDRMIAAAAASADSTPVVQFTTAAATDVLFQRAGDDLRVTLNGATDLLTLVNWFGLATDTNGNAALHVARFEADDIVLGSAVVDQAVTLSGAAPVSLQALWDGIV